MKKVQLLYSLVILALLVACTPKEKYSTTNHTDKNGYHFETVVGDPMGVRIYTLENGLKVYLSVNRDAPRIQTFIPVKAGSTYDPAETTGLAHYLEHMMFKGSDKFGTVDWKDEKPLLQEISDLFDQHKAAKSKEEKIKIYTKIDSVSKIAARYSVPNEYDKLVASIGAKGTNAYTTLERTVYMNDIPSNELEKWLQIESVRFSKLVLRLFHTELEAVYEEFNMSQDNDYSKEDDALMSGLYQKHPYGTQTTIGKAEHLKNPSMVNIHNYFSTYYVPNNMAIALSGDLDFEKTIQLIDKNFGQFKFKEVPKFNSPIEEPITKPIVKEVFGPDAENLSLAFRFKGIGSEDQKYVTLIDGILNNSQAGLIDLDLNQAQKVLRAGSYPSFAIYYGYHGFFGMPRQGQSLEEVKDLILEEIEKVKKGEFEDWMIQAVVNDYRLSKIKSRESNGRAHEFAASFANKEKWADHLKFADEMEKITKEQLVDFAKKHYNNNYVVVYKRVGTDKDVVKVEKPKITPIDIDRSKQSDFYKKFIAEKSDKLKPLWVDFEKEIQSEELKPGITYDYLKNNSNELFKLVYIFDMGKDQNKKLPIAVNYLPYIGTDKYSPAELQKEMFKYGLSFGVQAGDDRCHIYITGLKKSFDKGLELLEHIWAHAKANNNSYSKYVDGIVKNRMDQKLDKSTILWRAMMNYGKYGNKSSFTDIIQEEDLRRIKSEELTDLLAQLKNYKHRIFYYGSDNRDVIATKLKQNHKVAEQLEEIPKPIEYPEKEYTENQVLFVNYDMVQTNIIMLARDEKLNLSLIPQARLFNEYYGGSMASIIFQEIRESRALAYSAFSSYQTPAKPEDYGYSFSFVGTSPDKVNDATGAFLNLLNNMPNEEKQFEEAKNNMLKKLNSERITKERIYWTYLSNLKKGINYDYRKDVYEQAGNENIDQLGNFFKKHIANKKHCFLVIGNKKDINMNDLKKLGQLKELNLTDLFNY